MNKKQLIYSILALFLLGLIVASGTYAYYSYTSDDKNISFNTSKELENYVIYNEGESKFVGDFKVNSTYTEGMHSTISLYKTSEASNVDLIATIKMDINEIGANIKSSIALKWVVTSGTSSNVGTVLAQGNFIGVNNDDTLTLVPNIEVTTTETFYTIWIWLDENSNPSDELTGETLDTTVWTEINQVEGIEESFTITRVNANYQNINATVVNNKNKITSYAITTSNTEPNEWTSIETTNQSNVYNLDYTVLQTGTYYVWIKDSEGNTISRSIEVTSVDTTAPVCTFGSFNPTVVKNNVTSDIELTCIDSESSISYGNLKTSDITTSNNYITVTNIRKTSITNGNKYIITITGSSTDGTSTLTLPFNKVKNAVGLGNNSVTSGSITIRNIINLSGAEVTLNSNNYTYTGSDIEPTVTVTLDGNNLVKDTDYEVTYSNNTNVGEATITITGINNYEGEIVEHFNIIYNSFNVTLDNANATTNGTSTLYMRYLDGIYLDNSYNNKMTTSANNITIPIRTGYSFLGYYDNTTQLINDTGYITSSFTNNLYNSAKTLNASWVDDILPTGSLATSFSNNTISVTVTASDNGSGLIESYGYRVSTDSTCNDTVTFTDSTSNTYTFNTTDTGTHYACVRIEDNAGNYNYISSSLNIVSATFYYNSDATNGSKTIATKTVSCAINGSNCSITIPTEVINSVGTYNNAYAGLSTSIGNMTEAVSSNAATITISGNSNYYSLYRTNVTVYRPSSTSATTNEQFYRNEWFTSVSAISDPVLTTSTTGTSNIDPTLVSGYSFTNLRNAVNNGGTAYTVANAAKTNTTTFYVTETATATITATFYSSSNASGAKTNSTATGTRTTTLYPTSTSAATTSVSQGSISAPSSTAPYGTTLIGWATSASTMGTTTVNTANTAYYAIYRVNVTVYRPSSTSATTTQQFYRNSYYGTGTNYTTVLSTSNTGTSNTDPTLVSGYSFTSLRTAVSNGGTAYSVASAATTTTTTFYVTETATATITATFYRSSNSSGAKTSSTATGTRTTTLYPTSTSAATTSVSQGSITAPSSTAPYSTSLLGWATSASTMSTATVNTANTAYYAVYRANVTNYYYGSSYTSRTIYRNSYYGTATNYTTVLSTSNTGTSNYSTAVGPGSSVWTGLATSATTTVGYSSVAAAATSTATTLYTVYTFNVTYAKGSNVSAIGATSGSCKVTSSSTSCNVTLPSITPNTNYTSVGWNTTSGATTGTAAGSAYSVSSNSLKLYANAKAAGPISTSWSITGSGSSSSFAVSRVSVVFNSSITYCGMKYVTSSSECTSALSFTQLTASGSTCSANLWSDNGNGNRYLCIKATNSVGTTYSTSPKTLYECGSSC